MTIYKAGDIIVSPFPFIDTDKAKPRPVLIISKQSFNKSHEKVIALMITTAVMTKWPSDTVISHLECCGLDYPSSVRMKCFTLDTRLIKKRIGVMAKSDWSNVQKKIRSTIAL